MEWIAIAERPDLDKQPARQFVLVEGSRFHSGVFWNRRHWGVAYIRMEGADDELLQYRKSDIEQIIVDGDMDPWTAKVTHWAPAICAEYPAQARQSIVTAHDEAR